MIGKPDKTIKVKDAPKGLTKQVPKPDLKEAQRFLDRLDPNAESFTFQTFDDTARERKRLACIMHGSLEEHAEYLGLMNDGCAGVFVSVNPTDEKGRKEENITAIRAVMLDLDGSPLAPVDECELAPHLVVESSPGRYHCYWRVKDMPLEQYKDVQRGLAKRFDGDPDVAKLTACARLPGFWHCKGEPFQVRIHQDNKGPAYTVQEITKEFPPLKKAHKAPISPRKDGLVLPVGAPVEAGEAFLKHKYQVGEVLLLVHFRGSFYRWTGTHFKEHTEEALAAELYVFLHAAFVQKANGIEPYKPTPHKVREVLEVLHHGCLLNGECQAPFWIPTAGSEETPRPAADLISCRNGILNLQTRELAKHNPSLFITNCVPFNYNPKAPEPKRFLQLLEEIWPADKLGKYDQEAEETLQEIFGYLLTDDTSQQKIFLWVGPRRGGKGTLVFVLEQMLGKDNATYQTLDSLTGEFGRWPLIDKKLCVFTDARLGSRGNIHRLVETLLSVSGGDPQTINRKYGEFWTGRLGVRFLITTNALPALKDSSGTIASRFIMLRLTRSFYGKEDIKLKDKLVPELAGILNWALAGLDRLRERGYFLQPTSSKQSIRLLEDLAAPVGAFVKQWCKRSQVATVHVKELYHAYKDWCEENGHRAESESMFGKSLRDVVHALRAIGRAPNRKYVGIRLSQVGEESWKAVLASKGQHDEPVRKSKGRHGPKRKS